jgi:Family of unknown function (DUF6496)
MPATEQEKADVSHSRGVTAAHIPDSASKRDYIAAQGNAESKGMDKTAEMKQGDFNKRNELTVLGNMKKGGSVKQTGLYRLHAGEHVIPSPDVLTGLAAKTAPGGKKTKVVTAKKDQKLSVGDKKKVSNAMNEVFTKTPKTVKATGKTGEAARKMKVAIGLSKARAAGAKIPEKK